MMPGFEKKIREALQDLRFLEEPLVHFAPRNLSSVGKGEALHRNWGSTFLKAHVRAHGMETSQSSIHTQQHQSPDFGIVLLWPVCEKCWRKSVFIQALPQRPG